MKTQKVFRIRLTCHHPFTSENPPKEGDIFLCKQCNRNKAVMSITKIVQHILD